MDDAISDKIRVVQSKNRDATFSLFTLSGHVISGRITSVGSTITLAAGKETAEVPIDRVEAFSYRLP
jgi:hypothetical protein